MKMNKGVYKGTLSKCVFEMELVYPDFFVLKGYLNNNFSGHRTIPSDPVDYEFREDGIMILTRSGSEYLLEGFNKDSPIVKELEEIKARGGRYWNSSMKKS